MHASMYTVFISMQEPVTIELGERHVWKGSGSSRKLVTKHDTFIYIPVLQTLQTLLNNKAIMSEVTASILYPINLLILSLSRLTKGTNLHQKFFMISAMEKSIHHTQFFQ